VLDFVYYPVSFILWCWHKVFGFVFGEASAISWILGIIFLTFTVRGIMFKPFVNQVRSMKKMQDFAPEVKKVQKKYANDRQRQAQEMQKLQREHGVNPFGSCLPMLLQIPVFIGLNWVLRAFTVRPKDGSPKTNNYFFNQHDVESYVNTKLFGINLGEAVHNGVTAIGGSGAAGWHWNVLPVALPLMIISSLTTHFNARHSAARQKAETMTPQTAMMQKLTMYVFPLGVLIFGALFPLGLLFYWVANNGWTLMQQRLVYTKIDKEEEIKKAEAIEKRASLSPKPGQKPAGSAPKPGQKPARQQKKNQPNQGRQNGQPKKVTKAGSAHSFAQTDSDGSGKASKATDGTPRNEPLEAEQKPARKNGAKENDTAVPGAKKSSGRKRR
jgi:YidC/Oxa1 family membrane protein insertase